MRVSFIPDNLWNALSKSFQNLFETFFHYSFCYNEEVQVWQKCDRHGNTYWYVYDPKTGHSAHLGSEEEVMSWIESHYYF
ncbi:MULTISPECIES: hypothetical protein [Pseudanabaena]|uniref:Uncharacterized protein n=2 Tax=Pseudanabaena TaxID=1152 RepID=L8N495_9CYAN|nr:MULTISPECIES: hypothetical protein [Pseudanabaena]ELS33919.1 hypothetical protein Pse7429DRAFT_0995 [Pseudanabaena biceps PCC 7429]MDG3493883.1 hypothetical protein [Pseudanabaena catenata USMAC16]